MTDIPNHIPGYATTRFAQQTAPVLLAIIMPTYNRARCLVQILDQLASESAPVAQHLQIIISDNNSPDDTETIAREFIRRTDSTLAACYVRQPKNVGAMGNLDYLVRHANAQYCWPVSDDDLLTENAVVHVVAALQQLQPSDLVMLVRTTGIEEWDVAPHQTPSPTQPHAFKIDDPRCVPYILSATFLSSIIVQTQQWRSLLETLRPYHPTDYANWGVVLLSAQQAQHFHVLDQPCVRGNATMVGPSRIPTFRVLVMGRITLWQAIIKEPLHTLLRPAMLRLWRSGWKAVVAGNTDELKTTHEKRLALNEGVRLLGPAAYRELPLMVASLLGSVDQRKRLIQRIRGTSRA